MSTARILEGDCLDVLATLPERSVQTCITSPPYYGLRDYGTAAWSGGDAECDHAPRAQSRQERPANGLTGGKATVDAGTVRKGDCYCGATRTDSQIGLEETPEQYVANLVAVFREVRRVLRDDGCAWINLGDSYASSSTYNTTNTLHTVNGWKQDAERRPNVSPPAGCKPKDLLGIPWMVAFALRADGWYLRSDIIWAKPNPMPESVTDRPTKAHEYLFLLSKSRSYFWDADAVREDSTPDMQRRAGAGHTRGNGTRDPSRGDAATLIGGVVDANGRNKRSVWTVATQPYPGAHFATFPPKLIEPCVLAGSSPQACAECGAPWERVTERETPPEYDGGKAALLRDTGAAKHRSAQGPAGNGLGVQPVTTLGWQPTCDHSDGSARCTVLDPFSGAGTTGVVALRHDRDYIGVELNPTYAQMARDRIYDDGPLLNLILGDAA